MKPYHAPQNYSVYCHLGKDPPCQPGKFLSSNFIPKFPLVPYVRRIRRTARGENLLFNCYPDFFLLCHLESAHLGSQLH